MIPEEIDRKLSELYSTIEEMGARIDAPRGWLPTRRGAANRSKSWLEIDFREADDGDDEDGFWISVVSESDGPWVCTAECLVEYSDYLLYQLFEGITHNMAMAKRNPAKGEDARRSLFEIQEALLARINADWAVKTAERHAQILVHFPFKDP